MDDELAVMSNENEAYLVAQAARAHAQKAEELASGLASEISNVKEHSWTRKEHEDFWDTMQASTARAQRRVKVLLVLAGILLGLILGLWVLTAYNQNQDTHALDITLHRLSDAAVASCERGNVTRDTTRTLYTNLRAALAEDDPDLAAELDKALAALPENPDCSQFGQPVNP
jgi:hypothetical protein